MKSFRENPEGEENQRATRDHDRAIFAAKMQATVETWRNPPPGTKIVREGKVQKGDWFYIYSLGAWTLVPEIGWGESISPYGALIARGELDGTSITSYK